MEYKKVMEIITMATSQKKMILNLTTSAKILMFLKVRKKKERMTLKLMK
jgi:hypothetical protein